MAKLGFQGQWIELAKLGSAVDSTGVRRDLDRKFLEQVVANYNAGDHEAPLVVGHPDSDTAPAFGWTAELRLNGDTLEFKAADTNDEFEQAVAQAAYKKRSGSFYLNPPNLRHIGFLGAQPPAIKGLQDIKFADGESFAVETFNLQEKKMEEKDLDQLPESFWTKFKSKLGIGDKVDLSESSRAGTSAASFSEADARSLITDAVTEATAALTADFTEKLTAKDTEIQALTQKVDGQIAGGVRAEIASFVESIPAEKGKHFLKRIHVGEFLEKLAIADAASEKPAEAISFSEGTGEDKVEFKSSLLEYGKQLILSRPNSVEFGEKFGNIVATKEADMSINTDRVEKMKKAAGVQKKEKGGN